MLNSFNIKKINLIDKLKQQGIKKIVTIFLKSIIKINKDKIGIFIKDLKEPIELKNYILPNNFRIEVLSKDRKDYFEHYKKFRVGISGDLSHEEELLENGICFLGFIRDEIVAYFWVITGKIPYLSKFEISIDKAPTDLYIDYNFVKNEFRGKGIGSYFKKRAIEIFCSNYRYMWSAVYLDNISALKVHKKNGFIPYAYGTKWNWFLFKWHSFKRVLKNRGYYLKIKSFGKKEVNLKD